MRKNPEVVALLTLMFAAAVVPLFLDIYRITAFRVMPYDDYAPYLLWLLGEPGGQLPVPASPHAYRVGAVALALPFYYLPLVEFGQEAAGELLYKLATQAICMANVFYVGLAALTMAAYARFRLHVGIEWTIVLTLTALLLSRYEGMNNVDGIAALPMVLLFLAAIEKRIGYFCLFLAIGALVNEKTIIASFMFVFLRLLTESGYRRDNAWLVAANVVALGLYVVAINVVVFPGNEYQRDLATYVPSALGMIALSLTAKGFYINLWPVLVLAALWAIAIRAPRSERFTKPVDIGVLLGLTAMAMLLDVKYAVGRMVMYALPLYLIGAVQSLAWMLNDDRQKVLR